MSKAISELALYVSLQSPAGRPVAPEKGRKVGTTQSTILPNRKAPYNW